MQSSPSADETPPQRSVSIRPVWTVQSAHGSALPARLVELLRQVQSGGSLQSAAGAMGLSYRHAWDLIRQAEGVLGAALLHMERGKGSRLTPLGDRLVWADHRIHARLKPVLDSLASELAAEIDRALDDAAQPLRIHASHGFAIERLVERLQASGMRLEISYGATASAAAALLEGSCDLAGLHVPLGPMRDTVLAHYARWLVGERFAVIDIANRRQGLMVRAGNPKAVSGLADLQRAGVRFVNREPGSGTRLLLESMLRDASLDPEAIAGFAQFEYTHSAVAAFVASGMADVGFGLEPPARRFGLDFVPLASERYFLLCREAALHTPALRRVVEVLSDPALRASLDALPGYDAGRAGRVTPFAQAFTSTV